MAGIKHKFVSNVADGEDTNLVRPSDWNAEHDIDISINELSDVNIASPINGNVLTYDNATSKWVNRVSSGGADILEIQVFM